jgi:Raf kinase inhibitor-like YbhB/YbcL family protein
MAPQSLRFKKLSGGAALVCGAALCGALGVNASVYAADDAVSGKLNVTSRDFAAGALIPVKFTGDGPDRSPALSWSAVPSKTQSIAVTCTDPDAPRGVWWHWIVFNLPAQTATLAANQPKSVSTTGGGVQGVNDFGNVGYNGPAPPKGPIHHYNFDVYALDAKLDCKPTAGKQEFSAAIKGHILASGRYTGVYVRR